MADCQLTNQPGPVAVIAVGQAGLGGRLVDWFAEQHGKGQAGEGAVGGNEEVLRTLPAGANRRQQRGVKLVRDDRVEARQAVEVDAAGIEGGA